MQNESDNLDVRIPTRWEVGLLAYSAQALQGQGEEVTEGSSHFGDIRPPAKLLFSATKNTFIISILRMKMLKISTLQA